MTRTLFRLWTFCVFLVVIVVSQAQAQPATTPGQLEGWIEVGYGALVDARRLSQSGQAIATLLKELGGRPYPSAGERQGDAAAYRQLEPLLEPYAFVLRTRPRQDRTRRSA